MRTGRTALTFSLLALWVLATGEEYAEMSARLRSVRDPEAVLRAVKEDPRIAADEEISETLGRNDLSPEAKAKDLRATIEMRSMLEAPTAAAPPAGDVKKIKSSPLYRDSGVSESSNWLARALERLRNLRLNLKPPQTDLGFLRGLGPVLYVLFWTAIAGALAALIYFAVKHFRWRKRLARKASALLAESEPERTLDEWLELADRLESEGQYREAVRALYLACLLRFDEALVARFDRGETNWEHLRRIEASPRKPLDLEFRSPTRLFDRVWYGHLGTGRPDVAQFREWYVGLTERLRGSS
jgi:hypothetical protein